MADGVRRTKIIATLGSAPRQRRGHQRVDRRRRRSLPPELLARHARLARRRRDRASARRRSSRDACVAVLQDLAGPKIRTGRARRRRADRAPRPARSCRSSSATTIGGPGPRLDHVCRTGDRRPPRRHAAARRRPDRAAGRAGRTRRRRHGRRRWRDAGEHKGINAPGVALPAGSLTAEGRRGSRIRRSASASISSASVSSGAPPISRPRESSFARRERPTCRSSPSSSVRRRCRRSTRFCRKRTP